MSETPDQHAEFVRATCPECGSDKACPADDLCPRWEDDPVRVRLGFPIEGRCPNCGDTLERTDA